MRHQIRLIVSPAQIGPTITALETSPNRSPESDAFLKYLRGKQFALSNGDVAVAYTTKAPKPTLADGLGFDTVIAASQITPENVSMWANVVKDAELGLSSAKEMLITLSDADKKEIKSFMSMMMMPVPADF